MGVEIDRAEERAIHERLRGFKSGAFEVSLQTLLTAAYLQGMQDACEILARRTRSIEARGDNFNSGVKDD